MKNLCSRCCNDALPLTVHQYRRDRLLVQQVRQLLSAQPQDTHSAEALAALLNVSPRTLHRQLREEGATLQALKDEVRHSKAGELLLRSASGHQAGGGGRRFPEREELYPRLQNLVRTDAPSSGAAPHPEPERSSPQQCGQIRHRSKHLDAPASSKACPPPWGRNRTRWRLRPHLL